MFRKKAFDLKNLVESPRFTGFITTLIIINAITLGLETNSELMASEAGPVLTLIDSAILAVFTIEIILKLWAYRAAFFRSGWNIFDFTIVAISLIPASGPLSVLRAFRILRVLRLFSMVPQMRRVINALFHALPGMASVVSVLLIVFYVAAVLATKLFGTADNAELQIWFGSIGASMFTLFQIMTLESWSMGIVRPTLELYPWAWAFFVPFIIVTSFAVLNLFIGIVVDSMNKTAEQEDQITADTNSEAQSAHQTDQDLQNKINRLEDRIDYLSRLLENEQKIRARRSKSRLKSEKKAA